METKKLGFGLMRLPLRSEDAADIDIDQLKAMVDLFLERGYNYFDTSYVYHNGASENAIAEALCRRHERSSYRLASKFPAFLNIEGAEKIEAVFAEQLGKCGVEYFDYYLLHNLNRNIVGFAESSGLFEHAKAWRNAGRIKHLGFSWHDSAEELGKVLDRHPEIEFVQIVLNYYDWDEPVIQSRACYDVIRSHGCKVVVMEPVKGGALANVPDAVGQRMSALHPEFSPAIWALRFAADKNGLIAVLSGMSDLSQVDENTSMMSGALPLSDAEREVYDFAKAGIADGWKFKCSDWDKLDAAAPNGVPVSHVLRLYNSCLIQPNPYFAAELNYYKHIVAVPGFEDLENLDYSACTKAVDSELDVTSAVREAAAFLRENGF